MYFSGCVAVYLKIDVLNFDNEAVIRNINSKWWDMEVMSDP